MPTETGRHRLYEKIRTEWGEEHATELMSHLPPVGWADVATKQDLAHLSTELRSEIAHVRTELRGEIAHLRTELRGEIAHLGTELHSQTAILGAELRGELHKELTHHLRWIVGTMIALTGIFATIVHWLG